MQTKDQLNTCQPFKFLEKKGKKRKLNGKNSINIIQALNKRSLL